MGRKYLIFCFIFISAMYTIKIYTRVAETGLHEPEEKEQKIEPLTVGNFALPTSQQPGPLVGFGQNIVDKNDLQIFEFTDQIKGHNRNIVEAMPSILYGITDTLALFLVAPYFVKNKKSNNHSSGIEDLIVQLECAFYTKKSLKGAFQTTVVTNITFPTGSSKKNPPTGFGSPSFFLGVTIDYQALYWSLFTSYGTILTTKTKHHTKFGNEFFYQCGLEGIIGNLPGWIFAWMIELDGFYFQRDMINNQIDLNSGFNTVFLTPSLWISSERLIMQIGLGTPVSQFFFGQQNKNKYLLVSNLGWKF